MQDVLAISIVVIAAGFLARQAWLTLTRKSGGKCGSCSNCGPTNTIKSQPLVTISLDSPSK